MPGLFLSYVRIRNSVLILLVAAAYFMLARMSLLLSFEHSNATPVWPPSGFAFVIILITGYRLAPGILIGAFAANLVVFLSNHTTDLPTALWISFIICIGNTAEALSGYYLLNKLVPEVRDNNYFHKVNYIFRFSFTAVTMCVVSSSIGTTAIFLGNIIENNQYSVAWLTWWLGDVSGVLLVTPLLLIWTKYFRGLTPPVNGRWKQDKIIEAAALFLILIITSGIVFANWFSPEFIFTRAFFVMPLLMWVALRFPQQVTINAIAVTSIIAIWGTINRHGPFADTGLNESLLTVEAFVCLISIMTMALNASIFERNQTEEALRIAGSQLETRVKERIAEIEDRNRFIETLFDSVEDLMAVFDKNGNYISVNRKVEDLYKIGRKDIIGKNILTLFPSVKESGMYDNLQKAIGGEPVHDLAYRSVISNQYFENFYIPLKNNKQEVYSVLVIGHDNTPVMEAAEKIEAINTKLTEAQRLAHIGSWQWNILENNISWSDELFRIFGLTPKEFEASYENYLRYIHPDEKEHVNKIVQEAYSNHQPFDFYHRIVRPDGSIRILHGRGEVFVNGRKEPVAMSGTAQDVTEIKQAEEEIKQMADELLRYNKELEQTNKELESFTFIASHDLQEPLRKIRTFLNLIEEKELVTLSESSKNYLKRTIRATEQMQQLIIDLLTYSKATGSEEHFKKTDLNVILQQAKNELKEIIEEKNVCIRSTQLPEMKVIPFQFQQLFINMISNSIKFSRPGIPPSISISCEIGGINKNQVNNDSYKKYNTISFTDNGIGFETKYNEKIFDLFQRLHNRNEYSGTGIGLSICKKIIENHGGTIEARGEPDKGATFTIYLPE